MNTFAQEFGMKLAAADMTPEEEAQFAQALQTQGAGNMGDIPAKIHTPGLLERGMGAVGQGAKDFGKGYGDQVMGGVDALSGAANSARQGVNSTMGRVGNTAATAGKAMGKTVGNTAAGAKKLMGDAATTVGNAASGAKKTVGQGLSDYGDAAMGNIDALSGMANSARQGVNSAVTGAKNFVVGGEVDNPAARAAALAKRAPRSLYEKHSPGSTEERARGEGGGWRLKGEKGVPNWREPLGTPEEIQGGKDMQNKILGAKRQAEKLLPQAKEMAGKLPGQAAAAVGGGLGALAGAPGAAAKGLGEAVRRPPTFGNAPPAAGAADYSANAGKSTDIGSTAAPELAKMPANMAPPNIAAPDYSAGAGAPASVASTAGPELAKMPAGLAPPSVSAPDYSANAGATAPIATTADSALAASAPKPAPTAEGPGLMGQLGQLLQRGHQWGTGSPEQSYGGAMDALTKPVATEGGVGSTLGNVGSNIAGAWDKLPGYGKLGLGAGAAGLGYLGANALFGGKKKKRRAAEPVEYGAELGKAAAFNFEKLRKERGFGPGNGGPKRTGTAAPRAESIGSKGKKCGSKGKPGCVKPMGSMGKKLKGSGCYKGCKSAADFGAELALAIRAR